MSETNPTAQEHVDVWRRSELLDMIGDTEINKRLLSASGSIDDGRLLITFAPGEHLCRVRSIDAFPHEPGSGVVQITVPLAAILEARR